MTILGKLPSPLHDPGEGGLCGHPAMTGVKGVYEAEGSERIIVKLFL